MLIAQFDVPVGEIDKVPPAFMLWSRKRDLHKRTPLWPFRPSNQAHVRFLRETIEKEQYDHARNTNFPRNSRNHFLFRRSRGKIAPTLKIVRHKIVCPIRRNDVSMAGINQRKRAPGRA